MDHRARQLLEDTRKAIASTEEQIRRHPYLEVLETQRVKKGKLARAASRKPLASPPQAMQSSASTR
jgi:hypothetical protein